jgi:hypothetical protein
MAVLAFAALALSIGYLVTSYQLNNLRSSRPRWIGGRQRDRRLLGHQSIGTNPNVFRKINLDATGSICQPLVRRGQTALRLCDQPPRSAQTAPAPVHLLTRSPSRLCASCRGSPIDHGAARHHCDTTACDLHFRRRTRIFTSAAQPPSGTLQKEASSPEDRRVDAGDRTLTSNLVPISLICVP